MSLPKDCIVLFEGAWGKRKSASSIHILSKITNLIVAFIGIALRSLWDADLVKTGGTQDVRLEGFKTPPKHTSFPIFKHLSTFKA